MPVLEFTHPPSVGDGTLLAVVYRSNGTIWNPVTETFDDPPRTAQHEIDLLEVSETQFAGLFRSADSIDPSADEYSVRFENPNNPGVALGVVSVAPSEITVSDLLALEVAGTDTGTGLMTVADVLRQLIAVAKGDHVVDRGERRLYLYELDGSTVVRSFDLTNSGEEASRRSVGS